MDIINKRNLAQAESAGLIDYYDCDLDIYEIPLYLFNNDIVIRKKVLSLLTNGKVFLCGGKQDMNSRLIMEVVNSCDENGIIQRYRYNVVIRSGEIFK